MRLLTVHRENYRIGPDQTQKMPYPGSNKIVFGSKYLETVPSGRAFTEPTPHIYNGK